VGAGFHPLLTGRENIYINEAILGMTKEETDKKFDEIVAFADIGDFLDVPVKHYSSGMFVRLGFAVAVHCEPDILLVDEVLAVGDFFKLRIHFDCRRIVKNPIFGVTIFNLEGLTINFNRTNFDGYNFPQISGIGYIDFCIDKIQFKPFQYVCSIFLSEKEFKNYLDWHEKCYGFNVAGNATNQGLINPFPKWFLKIK